MIDVHIYIADLIRAKDGDTIVALVDQGFGDTKTSTFRLNDIDTAETWRPSTNAEREHGTAATERLVQLIEEQTVDKPITFMQKYYDLKGIELPNTGFVIKSTKHGKYRWLATLYPLSALECNVIEEATSFNQILLDEGFEKRDFYEDTNENS